jgi:hypothetical protein
MKQPPLDPDVADTAPSSATLTVYDEEHIVTYLRMLDADAEGANWRDVARIVLHLDPDREPDRARKAFESHLSRAKWMSGHGYKQTPRGGALENASTLLPSLSQELPRERVFFAANQALPLGSAIPRIVIVSPVLVGLGACRPVLTARGAE